MAMVEMCGLCHSRAFCALRGVMSRIVFMIFSLPSSDSVHLGQSRLRVHYEYRVVYLLKDDPLHFGESNPRL